MRRVATTAVAAPGGASSECLQQQQATLSIFSCTRAMCVIYVLSHLFAVCVLGEVRRLLQPTPRGRGSHTVFFPPPKTTTELFRRQV